ncbi:MAG: hypothetical protein CME26_13205 [Gemmatimonadetes bacterium]|nr:hypothetical protein [Gemmatimonadota bacterium]
MVSYDLLTGKERWVHTDSTRFQTILAGIGPRATPTVDESRVCTYGAQGHLNCLDLETGRKIWGHRTLAESDVPDHGISCSPLLYDGAAIVSVGGQNNALVAFEAETGEVRWRGGDSDAGYSSPAVSRISGRKQILIFNDGQLAAHDVGNGSLLWSEPWPNGPECVAQPIVLPGDRVFLSTGYGIGSTLFRVTHAGRRWERSVLWETPRMKLKFSNAVVHEGLIYGLDDGILACLDPATGKRQWKGGRYGHGQILLVGDRILVQAESGELVLVEADASRHREVARHPALSDKTWNNPALAAPYLPVRNHREAICFKLAFEPSPQASAFRTGTRSARSAARVASQHERDPTMNTAARVDASEAIGTWAAVSIR